MYYNRRMISLVIAALSGSCGVYLITPRRHSSDLGLIGTYVKQKLTHTWSKRSRKRIPTKRIVPVRKLVSKMRAPTMRKSATLREK